MSVSIIFHKGIKIIHFDLEDVQDRSEQIDNVCEVSRYADNENEPIRLLVNIKRFMPKRDYMEFASKESSAHKSKVYKAAYYNIDNHNKALFDLFVKFNSGIKRRKSFKLKEDALEWLVEE